MNGYPRLYIGKAALELKKRVRFNIYQVNKDTLSEFIDYYSTIPYMKTPLIIEDITYLPIKEQSNLLKFIEDSKLNIILLASEDTIISTVLSRMSLIYKMKEDVTSLFLSSKEYNQRETEDNINREESLNTNIIEDEHYLTYIKKEMKESPITYYYEQRVENKPNKQKLLQLISD